MNNGLSNEEKNNILQFKIGFWNDILQKVSDDFDQLESVGRADKKEEVAIYIDDVKNIINDLNSKLSEVPLTNQG